MGFLVVLGFCGLLDRFWVCCGTVCFCVSEATEDYCMLCACLGLTKMLDTEWRACSCAPNMVSVVLGSGFTEVRTGSVLRMGDLG